MIASWPRRVFSQNARTSEAPGRIAAIPTIATSDGRILASERPAEPGMSSTDPMIPGPCARMMRNNSWSGPKAGSKLDLNLDPLPAPSPD